MMMNVYARPIMIVSFVVASVLGASFVFAFWMDQSIAIGATRSVLFVVILACVHLAGYLLYVRQFAEGCTGNFTTPSASATEVAHRKPRQWFLGSVSGFILLILWMSLHG